MIKHLLGSALRSKSWSPLVALRYVPPYLHSAQAKASRRGHSFMAKPAQDTSPDLQLHSHSSAAPDQDLVLDVLGATATKREARPYLSRFQHPRPPHLPRSRASRHRHLGIAGVNLGNLFASPKADAVDDGTSVAAEATEQGFAQVETLRLAVIVLRESQSLSDESLRGLGVTLRQLMHLGLRSIVVVDTAHSGEASGTNSLQRRRDYRLVADRVVAALEHTQRQPAQQMDGIFDIKSDVDGRPSRVAVEVAAQPKAIASLMDLLAAGIIPVVLPFGITASSQSQLITCDQAVLALVKKVTGSGDGWQAHPPIDRATNGRHEAALDRLIILSPQGALPWDHPFHRHHVFVNLAQDYNGLMHALEQPQGRSVSTANLAKAPQANLTHQANLTLTRDVLAFLPSSSSALLTTAAAAARSESLNQDEPSSVGTRSWRNLLVHNLLTDKPTFSSSLPPGRRRKHHLDQAADRQAATFVKLGMPLKIFPDPRVQPWLPMARGSGPGVALSSPQLDMFRLVGLIEDSFGRKLDAERYFARIESCLAGIIIAGDYEGGAIMTWEAPPDSPTDPLRKVPYLDKFAVLKRSQGAGGVADVMFSAMVQECFPFGVCWRSRSSNPVNKWYFERSRGSWRLPCQSDQQEGWTMFWTTEGLTMDRFHDYAAVCSGLGTTWADGSGVED